MGRDRVLIECRSSDECVVTAQASGAATLAAMATGTVAAKRAVPRFFGPDTPFPAGPGGGRQGRCSRSRTSRTSPPRQRPRREPLFLNNRYHDPITAQFISVDPLVASTGEPYIYGSANPVTYSDPDGLCPISGPGSAEACWAFAAVDYTTTVHVTDELITVSTAGRPSVHHERDELRTAHLAGDGVFQEFARGLDSILSTVGDASDDLKNYANVVAAGCVAYGLADRESIPFAATCAGAAGSVSLTAEASALTVELFESGRLSDCSIAGGAHTVLVPSGLMGEYGTSLAMEFTKLATGGALGLACND